MSIAFDTVSTDELRAQVEDLEEVLGELRSRPQSAMTMALAVEVRDLLEELNDEWTRRGVRHAIEEAMLAWPPEEELPRNSEQRSTRRRAARQQLGSARPSHV